MFKKITAVVLALLFCFCAFGCSQNDPDAPDGMKSATVDGEPFKLYVPESWSSNIASGISGAYYSAIDGLSVSARYYTPSEAITKEAYLDLCIEALSAEYVNAGFVLTENKKAATLGGKDAARISYEFKNGDVNMVVSQTTAAVDETLISLYTYCPKAEYEARKETLEEIRGAFVITGFSKGEDKGVTLVTKDTPDGMKLASNKNIEYRLFVPTSWVCNPESGASEAYYPESGHPNVTVTSYVPDVSMSISDYFAKCEAAYALALPEYTRIGEATERKIDGKVAYSYTYTTTVDGQCIKIMQTIFVHDSSFYTITYTAHTDSYDKHTADVEKILSAFKFR